MDAYRRKDHEPLETHEPAQEVEKVEEGVRETVAMADDELTASYDIYGYRVE